MFMKMYDLKKKDAETNKSNQIKSTHSLLIFIVTVEGGGGGVPYLSTSDTREVFPHIVSC